MISFLLSLTQKFTRPFTWGFCGRTQFASSLSYAEVGGRQNILILLSLDPVSEQATPILGLGPTSYPTFLGRLISNIITKDTPKDSMTTTRNKEQIFVSK